MRPIQPRLKGFKTEAPALFAAPENADDFGHDVIRLDAPKESDADDSLRQESRVNPKPRPTNKHAWRAPDVMADPFDDPLH